MNDIEVSFLCQGCQTVESVAHKLAGFLSTATKSIDICIYSFSLGPEPRAIILSALQECASRGVQIRIAYDEDNQDSLVTVAPHYNNQNKPTTAEFVQSLGFPSKAIKGFHTLMHNKYVVIDQDTPDGKVWTGSANFSNDSWSLQESNIVILNSQQMAAYYTNDFNELWVDADVASKSSKDSGEATLQYKGQPAHVLATFAPIEGEWIDETIAGKIDQAQSKITVAAVVITSGKIINALLNAIKRGVPIEGIYDLTQMEGVKYQWQQVPANNWKIGAFQQIVEYGKLAGKKSTPYTTTSIHDYMHNKVMVLDDLVITGSYNFSRHAQANAENVLMIQSAPLANTYREYIGQIVSKYSGHSPTS